jgi:hypothetical protein
MNRTMGLPSTERVVPEGRHLFQAIHRPHPLRQPRYALRPPRWPRWIKADSTPLDQRIDGPGEGLRDVRERELPGRRDR